MNRVRTLKVILWAVVGLAVPVVVVRFWFGLGATTALNDATPWGLWIGFDVLGGVALAAGGFLITATVYVLKREEFHPIVRPAVLTAFLGYVAAIVGLLMDLGRPWNIWHPVVFWQHHSVLFEVAWCVMLYTTVLFLEFLPVPLESLGRLARLRAVLVRWRLPLVILGIMLSTLHQSSLGSLFLIMPLRLHGLWHTPLLPGLFLLSAVGLGLMVIALESLATGWLYGRKPEMALLSKLARAAAWVLGAYLVVRLVDIGARGRGPLLVDGSWESLLFVVEMAVGVLGPVVLLSLPVVRSRPRGLGLTAILVVLGFVLNRINVGGLTMLRANEMGYFPAWTEFAISAGVVAAAMLAFLFAVERFNVWEQRPADPEADPLFIPRFERAGQAWLGEPTLAGFRRHSLAFIVAVAVGASLVSIGGAAGSGSEPTPVRRARGGDVLRIDGNRNDRHVTFKHAYHIQLLGAKACASCHHMQKPFDQQTPCAECHADMHQRTSIFNHDLHAAKVGGGGNRSCHGCHPAGQDKLGRTALAQAPCRSCHQGELALVAPGATLEAHGYRATGYLEAMHGLCIGCHAALDRQAGRRPHVGPLSICTRCHVPAGATTRSAPAE